MRRNTLYIYPDGSASVFHPPFCATGMYVQLVNKGAAVLVKDGVQHVFSDLRVQDSFRIADDEGTVFTARYAGEVPK